MQKNIPPSNLARDSRFNRITTRMRFGDPRQMGEERRVSTEVVDADFRAVRMMHGIFVGEIQALEGAGRTCFDFEAGTGPGDVPFELKLDMARQCWDEARHCEISIKLASHMGGDIGEFAEATTLFEAACHPDPVFRLAGVNRALEGLAIDVFTGMREFGILMNDPVLEFCEDWMLADEVTHVRMGSRWLKDVTAKDPERRARALEFQRTVDGLFNMRGARSEDPDAPIRLARNFREMAGFTSSEVDEIAADSHAQRREVLSGAY